MVRPERGTTVKAGPERLAEARQEHDGELAVQRDAERSRAEGPAYLDEEPTSGDDFEPWSCGDVAVGPRDPDGSASSGFARYQVLFRLAKGGMGTVYLGRLRAAHGFDRLVAIKKPSLEGATADDIDAFRREARLSAQIDHPNVVKTFELGEHRGEPFSVMELIQGVSLARLCRRLSEAEKRLDPHLALWIAAQVASGLHAVHELCSVHDGAPLCLVHRDVSPDNVLLSFDGRVYLSDFGIAKEPGAAKKTESGVVKGKFAYMSPEQIDAVPLDRRSDLFSLGTLLHEALTGQPLFEGRSLAETVRNIWSREPPDPSAGRPDVPSAVGSVIRRCLEREPERRYPTAAEMGEALRCVLREAGAQVDEGDLASLLAATFPEARERLKGKIRAALKVADSDSSAGRSFSHPIDDDAPADRTSEVAAARRKWPRIVGFVLLAAFASGAALTLSRTMGGDSSAVPDEAPAPAPPRRAAATEPGTAADPPREPEPTAEPEAIATAETHAPSPRRPPTAPSKPTPAERQPTVPGIEDKRSAPGTGVKPSAPEPSSHGGVPFQEL